MALSDISSAVTTNEFREQIHFHANQSHFHSNQSHFHSNQSHFHEKGFALRLV